MDGGGPGLLGPQSSGTPPGACSPSVQSPQQDSPRSGTERGRGGGGGGMPPCASPQNATSHETSGDGSESSRERRTVIYGAGICCQTRNRDLISGKSSSCMRADGEVCAMLSPVQLSIYYYSASPDPPPKQTFVLAAVPGAPGRGDADVLSLYGWLVPPRGLEPSV